MKQFIIVCLLVCMHQAVYAQSSRKHNNVQQPDTAHHLKIYPAIADKYVNIYVDFDMPQDFTLMLPATDKNEEKKWTVHAKTSYQNSLDVSNLPEGDYTIKLDAGAIKEKLDFSIRR